MKFSPPQTALESLIRRQRSVQYPLALAFISSVLTLGFGICAVMAIDNKMPPDHWLDIWKRWDAASYLNLAQHGYEANTQGKPHSSIAYLPLYPCTIRLAHLLIRDWHLAALVVSNLCCAGVFVFYFLLTERELNKAVAKRAVFILSIFPTSYFLHIAYSESLFLLLTIGSFYYGRKKQWLACSLMGMLATGTRIMGIAIIPALAVEYLQQKNFRWREAGWDAAWLILVPLGIVAYLFINYRYFGYPFHFLHIQRESWSHYLCSPLPALHGNWDGLTAAQPLERVGRHGPQLVAFVIASVGLIVAPFRLRLCYTVYLLLTWIMIFCDNFPLSSPRYLLTQFPLFTMLATWCRSATRTSLVCFACLIFYALYSAQFARGWWGH
jgi:Mannosyltransferase (PIG-V)